MKPENKKSNEDYILLPEHRICNECALKLYEQLEAPGQLHKVHVPHDACAAKLEMYFKANKLEYRRTTPVWS